MKNKKLVTALCIVSAVAYFGSNVDTGPVRVPESFKKRALIKNPSKAGPQFIYVEPPRREPGSEPIFEARSLKGEFKFIKKRIQHKLIKGSDHPALPEDLQFAERVFAVKNSEYTASMGEKIQELNGFILFETDSKPTEATNVVVDPKTQKLYTVNSVLKIEKVDEGQRRDLIAKGFEEHYYHENLRTMYIQTNHDELLKLHEELTKLDLSPQLEIVRSHYRSR